MCVFSGQISPPSSPGLLLPLESNVGHKAHNHSSQDGAIDRNEVVSGASGHYRLGAAHHSGHHICHCAGYEVLIWRYLGLLGAGGRAVGALWGCRPCDPSVRDFWGTGSQKLGPFQAFPFSLTPHCFIMSLQPLSPCTLDQAWNWGLGLCTRVRLVEKSKGYMTGDLCQYGTLISPSRKWTL